MMKISKEWHEEKQHFLWCIMNESSHFVHNFDESLLNLEDKARFRLLKEAVNKYKSFNARPWLEGELETEVKIDDH